MSQSTVTVYITSSVYTDSDILDRRGVDVLVLALIRGSAKISRASIWFVEVIHV